MKSTEKQFHRQTKKTLDWWHGDKQHTTNAHSHGGFLFFFSSSLLLNEEEKDEEEEEDV